MTDSERHGLPALLLAALLPVHTATAIDSLDELAWQNRIILVRAAEAEVDDLATRLRTASAGIDERDVAWFVVSDTRIESNLAEPPGEALRTGLVDRYFSDGTERVVLVGKDGGIKNRSETLDLDNLFFRIDQMPMRRTEMGEQ